MIADQVVREGHVKYKWRLLDGEIIIKVNKNISPPNLLKIVREILGNNIRIVSVIPVRDYFENRLLSALSVIYEEIDESEEKAKRR